MAQLVEGDIIEVRLVGEVFLQRMITVLHYRAKEGFFETEYVAGINAFYASFTGVTHAVISTYLSLTNVAYSLDEVQVQKVNPPRFPYYNLLAAQDTGTSEGDCLPPGNSVSITKRGELANRHGIGGVRMPAVSVGSVDAGRLTVGSEADYATFAAKLNDVIGASSGNEWEPIILNRAAPETSQIVVSLTVQESIRTMSRRVLGRGI